MYYAWIPSYNCLDKSPAYIHIYRYSTCHLRAARAALKLFCSHESLSSEVSRRLSTLSNFIFAEQVSCLLASAAQMVQAVKLVWHTVLQPKKQKNRRKCNGQIILSTGSDEAQIVMLMKEWIGTTKLLNLCPRSKETVWWQHQWQAQLAIIESNHTARVQLLLKHLSSIL